jgi:NADPH2:quinone reductase
VRAAICREYGPPEVVRVEELPSPPLGPGQVRVEVRAAAVGYPDVLLVAGQHPVRRPVPFIPGSEYAGIVTEVARDVVRPKIGERVFGTTGAGAFGRELVVAAGAVRAVPAGLNDRVAAAFGVAHRLAYHVLRTVACLQPGEELVVLGAGGGVGLATVQIGAVLGASVTAVSSSAAKLEAAAVAGARHLVDHRGGDLREALARALPGGADVVVDPVGGTLAEPALEALRWAGRFVTVGFASGVIPRIPLNLVLLNGIRVLGIQLRDLAVHRPDEVHRNEEELMGLLAGGYVTPHVGAVFGLEQAAAALRYVADGRAIGTVVLDVASPCLASPCWESPCWESPCQESPCQEFQWPESAGTTAST